MFGTDKIAKALGPNYDSAKPAAAMLEATCAAVFAQIEAGVITSPEAARAALGRGPALDDEGNPVIPGQRAEEHAAIRRYADAVREIDRHLAVERQALIFQALGRSGDREAFKPADLRRERLDAPLARLVRRQRRLGSLGRTLGALLAFQVSQSLFEYLGREQAWRSKGHSRKALPKQIAAWEKTADELRKEAKGLR